MPADLQPPLADALADAPAIYADGCHLSFQQTVPGACEFGDQASATTVVLFGDSKAGQWFPALELLAQAHHWRLISMTKSACPAAEVTPWSRALGRPYTECDTWRSNVLARIASLHPAEVVVSDDRLYQLWVGGVPSPVANALPTWYVGLQQTLGSLTASSGSVLLIGDTPRARSDPLTCLERHLTDLLACATPVSVAIDRSRLQQDLDVARSAGARFFDPTPLVCPSDPCRPVLGQTLVYREVDHLTATFVRQLQSQLGARLGLP